MAAALHNAAQNCVSNVHIARLSSEEFVQAWRGQRVFNRLEVHLHFQPLPTSWHIQPCLVMRLQHAACIPILAKHKLCGCL